MTPFTKEITARMKTKALMTSLMQNWGPQKEIIYKGPIGRIAVTKSTQKHTNADSYKHVSLKVQKALKFVPKKYRNLTRAIIH